jgi:hypothetical protein
MGPPAGVTRRALVAAGWVAGLIASPAFGQPDSGAHVEPAPAGRVLVVLVPTATRADDLAVEIGAATAQALGESRHLEAVDLRGGVLPEVEAARRRDVEGAVKAAKRGLEALERLELEGATSALEQAVDVLGAELDLLTAPERESLDEALFSLAAMAMSNGQPRQGEAGFVAVASLSPNYQPDPERFPPNVVHRFEAVRMMVQHRQSGTVIVETSPPGARVQIDGTARGPTPISAELADGLHVVAVRKLGYRSVATVTPVRAGKTSRAILDLEATPTKESLEALAQARDLAHALGPARALQVSHLALLTLSGEEGLSIAGSWIDVRAGKAIVVLPKTPIPGDPSQAGALIEKAIGSAEHALVATAPVPEPADESPLFEQWWFWAAVVAGGAAVAGVAVAASREGPRLPLNSHIRGF